MTCSRGIATVDKGFWRAGGTGAGPLTSASTVHACFNDEACVVAGAREEHVACNADLGYAAGGVLCGLCADGTHVRVGTACVACDTSGAATTKAVAAGLSPSSRT